jgi:hypothetical protein
MQLQWHYLLKNFTYWLTLHASSSSKPQNQSLFLTSQVYKALERICVVQGLKIALYPNNQIHGSDTSHSHSLSQETPLHANTPTVHPDLSGQDEDQCLRTCHIKTYGSCSNLLARTKRHIGRHLSCRCVSFVEENDKKSGYPPKDILKGFLAVYVGDAQEEQTWFVIPVCYFNHPLFMTMVDFID